MLNRTTSRESPKSLCVILLPWNTLVAVLECRIVEFTFLCKFTDTIVFRRKEALDATEEILSDNGIRQQCSPDVAPIWNNAKVK
jgi:hypothetical protein